MTAAQIRAAAEIVESFGLMDNEIVTFTELGSEGAVFYSGTFKTRGPRYLVARDGTYRRESENSQAGPS